MTQPDLTDITLVDLIDTAILAHGFTHYKRDYYFQIETMWQKENYAGQYLVCFKHCYDQTYQTLGGRETLLQSWDDCFINYQDWEKAGEPEGYVWGTNWANAYPGFSNVANSAKAKEWTDKLGIEMKELLVEAEIFKLNLVYHDWTIKKLNNDTGLISQVLFPLREKDDYEKIKEEAQADKSVKVEELDKTKGIIVTPNSYSNFVEKVKRKFFGKGNDTTLQLK